MPSRWDSATCGRRRRVFHYPPPTLMSTNFRLPRAIELRPLSLTPLKMRKVEIGACLHSWSLQPKATHPPRTRRGNSEQVRPNNRFCSTTHPALVR